MTKNTKNFSRLSDLIAKPKIKKPPAYQWQEFALRIIKELGIPGKKRNSVFKVSKLYPKAFLEKCLNDTKELCLTNERWKYFFKIIGRHKKL